MQMDCGDYEGEAYDDAYRSLVEEGVWEHEETTDEVVAKVLARDAWYEDYRVLGWLM